LKILITGSAGFIGSHLIRNLSSGHQTFGFDKILDESMDITLKEPIAKAMEEFQPEVVIHLAANANPRISVEAPWVDLSINTLGTLNTLAGALHLRHPPYFVLVSSAYVYGVAQKLPIDETHPTNPVSPYGVSKLAAEHYTKHFARARGLDYAILRFFNIYGPNQAPGYVIPDLIAKISALSRDEKSIKMRGHPDDSRDFLYVDDLIELIGKVLKLKPKDQTYNVGSAIPTRIGDLARMISHGLGYSRLHFEYNPTSESTMFYSDVDKAKEELNWRPRTPLDNGLEAVMKSRKASAGKDVVS
jgi:UDP-glucose 4-epimerase